MSLDRTKWAWQQQTDPLAKLVLLCLAEHHNGTDGRCDPSIETICRETGLSRATVFERLDRLRVAELIVVDSRNRGGNRYHLGPGNGPYDGPFEPQKGSVIRKGSTPHGLTSKEEPESLSSKENRKEREARKRARAHGSRLPDNFQPSISEAIALGLTPAQAQAEVSRFRDYWLAATGQRAVKADWPATWRNWCRRALEFAGPGRARGNGPAPPPQQTFFDHMMEQLNKEHGNDDFADEHPGLLDPRNRH